MKYRIQAALVFLAFLVMMVIPFAFWPARATIWGALALLIYIVLAACASLDAMESVCGLIWPPSPLPEVERTIRASHVAVAMTICDDACSQSLDALADFARAGFDIYVLDDSQMPVSLPFDLAVGHHLKRENRHGAKAGHLING